jgi:hypothetical protein
VGAGIFVAPCGTLRTCGITFLRLAALVVRNPIFARRRHSGATSHNSGTMSGSRLHTASEVARHCTEADCWVSVFGRVYDLTPLLAEGHGTLADPIIDAAGTDVSHWFDRNSGDVRAQQQLGAADRAL